ncbi:MAG: bifunctional diaminohydroxyphosphoribosylaminopyrimidine deaminase/5-amino-6-(5-phosphoribosylamino)uracil reductase RibD [Gammaproteobacteria bacterium]|nr:bifunctional diaminohydroxyphosphoribosylaminopyrimidine deaminase/5-amino-6-(5-phosphoribosylamino)uracil reductase RibD [Gammaproteobacteria bacterium]
MTPADDYKHMARALRLAERGLYSTHPNPRVGCVIVKDGQVVGEGWHEYAGGPHAEIHALQQAAAQAAGATLYVTLEPCCHHGRTPPCTDAVRAAGVKQVVVAMEDPNPQVAANGLRILQEGGIKVSSGVLAAEAEALNCGFVMRMRRGRPWVRAKLAMSLDGRTALASGVSQWITGAEARRDVHRLRARSAAIMTGVDTVLTDDPSLTVRLDDVEVHHQPLRVILDSRLRTPPQARLLGLPGNTLILTGEQPAAGAAVFGARVEVTGLPQVAGHMDLAAVLQHLGSREINEVHLEAGATLCGALLAAGLVDELVIYLAPHLMGDAARGLFALPGLERMQDRIDLDIRDIRAVGKDWRITARVST